MIARSSRGYQFDSAVGWRSLRIDRAQLIAPLYLGLLADKQGCGVLVAKGGIPIGRNPSGSFEGRRCKNHMVEYLPIDSGAVFVTNPFLRPASQHNINPSLLGSFVLECTRTTGATLLLPCQLVSTCADCLYVSQRVVQASRSAKFIEKESSRHQFPATKHSSVTRSTTNIYNDSSSSPPDLSSSPEKQNSLNQNPVSEPYPSASRHQPPSKNFGWTL